MRTYFLYAICILGFSCTRMVPLDSKTNNSQPSNVDYDDIPIQVKYIDTKYNHLILDVELINFSQDTLYISPQMIYYYVSDKPFDSNYNNVGKQGNSKHPTAIRKGYARSFREVTDMYRRKMNSKAALSALLLVTSAGLSVYDDIKDNKDSKKKRWTDKDEQCAVTRDALVSASLVGADLMDRASFVDGEDCKYLPYELFPERTVTPGENVRGKVYLHKEMYFKYYRIVVPINKVDYIFDFKKKG